MKSNRNVKNRLTHFEDCAQAIDQMFQAALRDQGPDAFNTFLTSARNFNNLSIYNAMLVRVQRPGADMVGSRKQWRKIGRMVLPDAIPIIILRPFGPVQFLYEQNDTKGRPIPGQDQNPLFAQGVVPEELYGRTLSLRWSTCLVPLSGIGLWPPGGNPVLGRGIRLPALL